MIVSWCNGSTTVFGSVCLGSSPGETTTKKRIAMRFAFFVPINHISQNYSALLNVYKLLIKHLIISKMRLFLLFNLLIISAFCYSQTVQIDGIEYTIVGDEASITDCEESYRGSLEIEEISYEGKTYPVTSVGKEAFKNCTLITGVSLPLVTNIEESAFYYALFLANINLPNATTIGENAFSICVYLTDINLPKVKTVGSNAFSYCALISLTLPEANTIGNGAFNSCESLNNVNLPKANAIGDEAFSDCQSLTNVSLPEVTDIGKEAFETCYVLTSVDLPKAAPALKENSFMNKSQISIYVNGTRDESEGYTAENGYDGFNEIVYLGESTGQDVWIGDIKYNIDGDAASIADCKDNYGGDLNVDNITYNEKAYPVTSVDNRAFQNCDALISVSLPLVTSIGANAFGDCDALLSVSLPKATTFVGASFNSCDALTNVDLPSVADIGNGTFSNCTNLESLSMPNLTTIGDATFQNCTSLTSISFPLVLNIENSSFKNCKALKSIDFPSVTKIGDYAFISSGLTSINTPLLTYIGNNSFSDCTKLESISLPRVNTTESYSFSYCRALESVNFPEITKVGEGTFYICNSLTSLNLPKATTIEDNAFYLSDGLRSITLHKRAPTLGRYCFSKKEQISLYVNGTKDESEGYTDENGYDGFKEIVFLADPTGIYLNEVGDVKAYVDESGMLHIDGVSDVTEIYVYDTLGNLISRSNNVQLSSGIYLVRVGSISIKVISK